jgi:NAD(P)-dependent dehydrogenase (short-subunit alcohol dehydrogenase family)
LFDLAGKNIILTGAAGILGNHFARGYLAYNASLVLMDIDGERLAIRLEELKRDFPEARIFSIVCDVSDPENVKQATENALANLKSIHVLHNNAGGKPSNVREYLAPFEDYTIETWKEGMTVNLDGVFLMSQAIGRQMIKQGIGGSVIQTASIYGIMAPDQRIYEGAEYMGYAINSPSVYTAAKAAVIGLTKYLATYWAHHNIRVNAITPGGVESGQNEVFIKRYSQRIPLNRMAKGEEMAGAAVYLASEASSYITGQNIIIDGGLDAW